MRLALLTLLLVCGCAGSYRVEHTGRVLVREVWMRNWRAYLVLESPDGKVKGMETCSDQIPVWKGETLSDIEFYWRGDLWDDPTKCYEITASAREESHRP